MTDWDLGPQWSKEFLNPALRDVHDMNRYEGTPSMPKYGWQGTLFDTTFVGPSDARIERVARAVSDYGIDADDRAIRAIARTTIPAEHLNGLAEVSVTDDSRLHDNAVGVYDTARNTVAVARGGRPTDIAHEIGHHVDNALFLHNQAGHYPPEITAQPTWFDSPPAIPYDNEEEIGRAEGFADAYSARHVPGASADGYTPASLKEHTGDRRDLDTSAYAQERIRWGQEGIVGARWDRRVNAVQRSLDAKRRYEPGNERRALPLMVAETRKQIGEYAVTPEEAAMYGYTKR